MTVISEYRGVEQFVSMGTVAFACFAVVRGTMNHDFSDQQIVVEAHLRFEIPISDFVSPARSESCISNL